MNICSVGCLHGSFSQMYKEIKNFESKNNFKVDIVIANGDMQTLRNKDDLNFISIPPKKKHNLCGDFHKYYSGEMEAPYLTIFIGGNHEASKFLRENYFGGFLAKNIYFMGYSGIVDIAKGDMKVRIYGLSGIFKFFDFCKTFQNNLDTNLLPLEYHVKDEELLKLIAFDSLDNTNQIESLYYLNDEYALNIENKETENIKEEENIDKDENFQEIEKKNEAENIKLITNSDSKFEIVLTHDWPSLVFHGPLKENIITNKPFFKDDIEKNFIGNKAGDILLTIIEPQLYLSAHYHLNLETEIHHDTINKNELLKINKLFTKK